MTDNDVEPIRNGINLCFKFLQSKFYQYGSIREALTLIYKNEGVRGLTCGLLPTLLRDAPFSAVYLMMYTWAKKAVPPEWMDSGPFVPYVRFSCGVVAGVGASLVTQPFDVIKTKMQLFPHQFQSITPVIVYVYQVNAQFYSYCLCERKYESSF